MFRIHDVSGAAFLASETSCILNMPKTMENFQSISKSSFRNVVYFQYEIMENVEHNIYITYKLLNVDGKIPFEDVNQILLKDCADI